MTTINPYSKNGYLAIAKETTAGTAVIPTVYLELLSEDIVVNYNRANVAPIAGKIDMNVQSVKSTVEIAGSITATVDPKNIGYLLQNFFGTVTTTTIDATAGVYEHVFTPQALQKTYTFDIRPAGDSYVQRYAGIKVSSLEISQADNKMQIVLNIIGQNPFTQARATVATVSATQVHIDQTKALVAADVVERRKSADPSTVNATAAITTVDSATQLTLATAMTLSVDDIVTIRKATPSYVTSETLVWIGGSDFGDGDDINNAETCNDTEDASWKFNRDVEARHAACGVNMEDRFPYKLFEKGMSVEGSFQHVYTQPKFLDQMRAGEKRALRCRIKGKEIDTNSAIAADVVIGTAAGTSSVRSTASVASETSNNLNIVVVNNNSDSLAASKSGNNITVKRATTDTTKNTGTLVASAVNALSGVTAAADGAGTGQVALTSKTNFGSGTNKKGRDANQKEQLIIDLPDTRYQPFNANLGEDELVAEEISYTAFYDTQSTYTAKMTLINDISSY